jgi:hypothetical protein
MWIGNKPLRQRIWLVAEPMDAARNRDNAYQQTDRSSQKNACPAT